MNPPLLQVELTLHFDRAAMTPDRLRYYQSINSDLLPLHEPGEAPVAWVFYSSDRTESLLVSEDQIQFQSRKGTSFPRLRQVWMRLTESFLDVMGIDSVSRVSLLYVNEIELLDLHGFRDYVNISFDMPPALMERIEFFRSEFRYKYEFGEIHVWLQPDWEDASESYCIQLSLESRCMDRLTRDRIQTCVQQLHEGIKDAFHLILSKDFIDRLPQ